MVVDDRVREVVADQRLGMRRPLPARRAIAGDGVAGPLEAGVAADVHVEQIARTGPLVSRRQAQLRSCSSPASSRGLWWGRLERSSRQPRLERACSLASRQRCHQRCAVAGETLKAAAAGLHAHSPFDCPGRARGGRPVRAWRYGEASSRSLLGARVVADPHPQRRPGCPLSRSQPLWARQLDAC